MDHYWYKIFETRKRSFFKNALDIGILPSQITPSIQADGMRWEMCGNSVERVIRRRGCMYESTGAWCACLHV